MKKILFLHIGVHRTGTTSIQEMLAANRKQLKPQGFHYAFDSTSHTGIAGRIRLGETSPEEFIKDLAEDADNADCPCVIVSGEDFCELRQVKALRPLQEHFEVRILVYLRRQDAWLESWYNQHVKWPWNKELCCLSAEEFLEHLDDFHWMAYDRLLERWSNVFGQAAITVRPFEKSQLGPSLEADFCRQCGIDIQRLKLTERKSNPSAAPQAIEFLRHMKLYGKDTASRLIFLNVISNAFRRAGLDTENHSFSTRQRIAMIDKFRDGNAGVARDHLGRSDGPLFSDPEPEGGLEPPQLTLGSNASLCQLIVRPVISDLLARIASNEHSSPGKNLQESRLVALERQHDDLFRRLREIQAISGSATALLSYWADRLRFWRRKPPRATEPAMSPEPPGGLPGWWQSDDEIPTDITTAAFLELEIEPTLTALTQLLKQARQTKGRDSEAIELLIEQRQADVQRLHREVEALESSLASPGATGQKAWRKMKNIKR